MKNTIIQNSENPFQDSSHFSFMRSIEESWKDILAEYDAVCHNNMPWPDENLHNGKWSVAIIKSYLTRHDGYLPYEKHFKTIDSALTPITSKLCEAIPGIDSYGFSTMAPGCEIFPHHGYTNKILRGHLGLRVNDNCGIMSRGVTMQWQEGKAFVFDDSELHSAWNRGNTTRVILIFDFRRP